MKKLKGGNEKRRMSLISLMDVVFILLIFFLVSVFFSSLPNEERKLFIPTPKNEAGSAQVLVQLIDDESFFFIDPRVTERLVNDITAIDRRGGSMAEKRNVLLRNCIFPMRDEVKYENNLYAKLNGLVDHADTHPEEEYFVIIRCPDDLPYSKVIEIIEILSAAKYQNVQYGCVGGTITDIRNSRRIEKRLVSEEGQIRKNVIIEF